MHWDVVEVVPAENRTLVVKFADGLSGTIRLERWPRLSGQETGICK